MLELLAIIFIFLFLIPCAIFYFCMELSDRSKRKKEENRLRAIELEKQSIMKKIRSTVLYKDVYKKSVSTINEAYRMHKKDLYVTIAITNDHIEVYSRSVKTFTFSLRENYKTSITNRKLFGRALCEDLIKNYQYMTDKMDIRLGDERKNYNHVSTYYYDVIISFPRPIEKIEYI